MRWITMMLLMLAGGCGSSAGLSSDALRWSRSQGGLTCDADACGLQAMTDELAVAAGVGPVKIYELGTDQPAAYAWAGEGIFVSAGLVRRLGSEELRAAIAHELGHLAMHACCAIVGASSLTGLSDSADEEIQADHVGAEILARCGDSRAAMTKMLRKLRECFGEDAMLREGFSRRIAAMGGK